MIPVTLIVIGAGRHGRIVAETARETGRFTVIGFADDNTPPGTLIDGIPVVGPWRATNAGAYIVAIGGNAAREEIFHALKSSGRELATVVSVRAHVSPGAVVGEGAVILAGAVIQAGARVGANTVINIGVLADHDAEVGDHANVAPGCVLACYGKADARERVEPGTVRGGRPPA